MLKDSFSLSIRLPIVVLGLRRCLLGTLAEGVLVAGIQPRPTGMVWFSGACPVSSRTMQIVWAALIAASGRFFSGKLLRNEPPSVGL